MVVPDGATPAGNRSASYFVIFLYPVLSRPVPLDVLTRHAFHLAELDSQGKLVLAGPVPDRSQGLIAVDVANLAAAKSIAEEDPLIRGGYQTYDLGTWILSTRANHFLPNLRSESRS